VFTACAAERVGVTGVELVVGYLAAWGVQKLRRAGQGVGAEMDRVLEAGLDGLHSVVTSKLGGDAALAKLEADPEQVSDRTARRVSDALAEAVEDDLEFATRLLAAIEVVRAADLVAAGVGSMAIAAGGGVAASRDINVSATQGGISAVTMGDVSVGAPPNHGAARPPQPGRSAG
jgi:hypothetical protein